MRIEFIGTGNAQTIPRPGCGCSICREAKFNLDRRRRAPCFAVTTADESEALILDAGDAHATTWLNRDQTTAILLSHFHTGHYHALLGYHTLNGSKTLISPPDHKGRRTLEEDHKGLDFKDLDPYETSDLGSFSVTPVLLNHSVITFGYCIETDSKRLAYLCDTCGLPPQTESFLIDWKPDVLIIDCNQHPKSPKPHHNTPKQAQKIHRKIRPKQSFLAHISCASAAWLNPKPKTFPTNLNIAHDGMVIDLFDQSTITRAKRTLI